MKDKLFERLKLMDEAIMKQHQTLQQANADMNMLNGCRQELVHIINMCAEDEKEVAIVVDENLKLHTVDTEAMTEVTLDHCIPENVMCEAV